MAIERASSQETRGRARTLVVRKGRELRTIPASDVVFARGADDYAELHLTNREVHLHEKSLGTLELLLPSEFVRVHRSYVVNFSRVRGLRTMPRVTLVMDDDSVVPVGRIYRETIRERFAHQPASVSS
jgi:two-component system response regulator LytT